MIRRPPRSTLFPTRRSSDLETQEGLAGQRLKRFSGVCQRWQTHLADPPPWQTGSPAPEVRRSPHQDQVRSEEHTSELQSQFHLVCRLLLEKKKKTRSETTST